jgi:hypothetical protein
VPRRAEQLSSLALAMAWAWIAGAFAEAGTPIAAVARSRPALAELAATSASIRIKVADRFAVVRAVYDELEKYEARAVAESAAAPTRVDPVRRVELAGAVRLPRGPAPVAARVPARPLGKAVEA